MDFQDEIIFEDDNESFENDIVDGGTTKIYTEQEIQK